MMVSASLGLLWEGMDTRDIPGFFGFEPVWRVLPGFVLGVLNIVATKWCLAQYGGEELLGQGLSDVRVQDVKKVILIVSAE